jgi:iron(III) transport system substrate-binding protein
MFKLLVTLLISISFSTTLDSQELIIYSGRSKSLVEPLIQEFEIESGIRVRVRYGDTSQLAVALLEEGHRSPADVFWAQDGGALGVLSNKKMFTQLPNTLIDRTPELFHSGDGTWVATSGRARVLAYAAHRVQKDQLPESIYELADPKWANRFGWAPQNASFQTFISAMVELDGREKVKEWLTAIRNNGARSYRSNVPIIQAIAAGEIDIAITNHYYLLRFKQTNRDFPVEQIFLKSGDPANFVNVAGAGILTTARNKKEAEKFIEFLLSPRGQEFFANSVFEYPVNEKVTPNPVLLPLSELLEIMPQVNIDRLDTLDDTLRLLREVGVL